MSGRQAIARTAGRTELLLLASFAVIAIPWFSARGATGDLSALARSSWTNYTDVNNVQGLVSSGDTLWVATTGGLVRLVSGPVTLQSRFTNADGLGDNDLRFVTLDAGGALWAGGLNGRLSKRVSDESWETYGFRDRDGNNLTLFSAAPGPQGFLWVGSSVGVHKFDVLRNGGEIKETYTRIGAWPASNPVHDLLIVSGSLWVVGPAGVARADAGDPFLLDPSRWETWTDAPDLNAVARFHGVMYAGGKSGLWAFVTLGIPGDTRWMRVGFEGIEIRDLYAAPDTLWVATQQGIGFCTLDQCREPPAFGGPTTGRTSVTQTADGTVWSGQPLAGLRRLRDGRSDLLTFNGPLDNTFEDVAVDNHGRVWCVHPIRGADFFDGSQWTDLPFVLAGTGGPATSVAYAPMSGEVWIGGWGGGAVRINQNDPLNDWTRFDTANSSLMWVVDPRGPNDYIVVRDVAVDSGGRVWFANAFADSGRALAYFDHGCWGYFGRDDGFVSDNLAVLLALGQEVLIGFANVGLVDLEYNLPLCSSGEPVGTIRRMTSKRAIDGLPSDDVRALLVDRADSLWVGTNVGLVRWAADIRRFHNVPLPPEAGLAINALAADGQNTIWVGTDRGLVMLPQGGDPVFFTPEDSPLVGSRVRAITVDDRAGAVWVGTTSGLSRIKIAVPPTDNIDDILAYPNPFELDSRYPRQKIRFNAPFGSRIFIFTVSGSPVIDFDAVQGWDGLKPDGTPVASGVYLFVVRGSDGEYGHGKIALVRRR